SGTKTGNWAGSVTMCVQDRSFTIQGVHDCFHRGYQQAEFKEIDTGNQTSWMIQLPDESLLNNSVVHSLSGNSPPRNVHVVGKLLRLLVLLLFPVK
ncbi:DUF1036 domain-containing protein, partial [Bartonella grahamii]|uniref:DUF1036 domain-containing protein n=1 Tax=Bartonella grahamii TaxID=33045 RepID=UPI001ABA24DF